MTMKTMWSKIEPILWFLANIFLFYFVRSLLESRVKIEELEESGRALLVLIVVTTIWWTGFRKRLANFLRESLRQMIAEELQESRIAFVTWLREDAPWRGENPFLPAPEEEGS